MYHCVEPPKLRQRPAGHTARPRKRTAPLCHSARRRFFDSSFSRQIFLLDWHVARLPYGLGRRRFAQKNDEIFRISGGKLLEGNRLIMFPEGTHQDKRFLGEFKFGYTRLAFLTAEMGNFEHDVVILPVAHHYSRYFGLQADFMVTVGEPISLAAYYELYQTKPRTAQREVNKLVRTQIEQMMLDVRDLDNYDAIDFIRETWGRQWALKNGKNPDLLPEKLASDQQLVAHLAQYQAEQPDEVQAIYDEARTLQRGIADLRIADRLFDACPSHLATIFAILAQILLLPLWVVALFPHGIVYNAPKLLLKSDKMFTNTLIFILDVVLLLPLFALATLLTMGLVWGLWWQAAVWILLCTSVGTLCVVRLPLDAAHLASDSFQKSKKSAKNQQVARIAHTFAHTTRQDI